MYNHDTHLRKWITDEIEVWARYSITLDHNGEAADARQWLKVGPAVGGKEEIVWLETNGNPILLGYREDDDDVEFCEDTEVPDWVRSALADEVLIA